MTEYKKPITKKDASRIQSAVDKNFTDKSDEESKKLAQSPEYKN